MTQDKISALDNRNALIDALDLSDLLGHLYSSNVINNRQMNSVADSRNRNETLIDILRRRSIRDYNEMIRCLDLTEQSHVAAMPLKCGGRNRYPIPCICNDIKSQYPGRV